MDTCDSSVEEPEHGFLESIIKAEPEEFESCVANSENYSNNESEVEPVHSDFKGKGKIPCATCGKEISKIHMKLQVQRSHEKNRRCDHCTESFIKADELTQHFFVKVETFDVQESSFERHGDIAISIKAEPQESREVELEELESTVTQSENPGELNNESVEFVKVEPDALQDLHVEVKLIRNRKISPRNLDCRPLRRKGPYFCDICGGEYPNQMSIVGHIRRHLDRPFICDHCPKKYIRKVHMIDHLLARHCSVKHYLCELCAFSSARKSYFKDHMRTHRKVECPICQKEVSIHSITKHKMRHTDIIKCSLCDKEIAKQNLKRHIRRCHNKNVSCKECSESFSKKGELVQHTRKVHYKGKVFECACGLVFRSLGALNVHKNEEKFNCQICQKTYLNKGSLKRHIDDKHDKRKLHQEGLIN